MEGLMIILGGVGIMACAFYFWLDTKKGKSWLKNL